MKKAISILILVILFTGLYFLFNNNIKNSKKVDVSDIEVQVDINRYDRAFMSVDTNNLIASLRQLQKEDTTFFNFYTNQMMRFGVLTDTVSPVTLGIEEFLTNPYVHELYDTVQEFHGELEGFDQELEEAFKHFKYYFPNKHIPKVYTVISEFSYNAVTLDTLIIALGLDLYMGKHYKYYGSFDFPFYLINRFEEEYMVPNCMEVLYKAHFDNNSFAATDALIYTMIQNGKKLYFMECMQPMKPKNILVGYSKEQLIWCEQNAMEVWNFYNEKDLFYSKDYMEHKRHVTDGPMTAGMPNEAPGNVGSWIGWQIVNKYMEDAKGQITLEEMLLTEPADILNRAGYKP